MGVVQVTVQAVSGPRLLGTGAAMVQFSRSVGAAVGTAAVATILFSILSAGDRSTATLFGSIIDQGPDVIASLTPARQASIHAEIGEAFRAAFLTIAAFTGVGTCSPGRCRYGGCDRNLIDTIAPRPRAANSLKN